MLIKEARLSQYVKRIKTVDCQREREREDQKAKAFALKYFDKAPN